MELLRKYKKRWYAFQRRRTDANKVEQWLLGFLPISSTEGFDRVLNGHINANNFVLLEPPSDVFYADPFIVREGELIYCFYEATILNPVFGHIEVVVLDTQGHVVEPPKVALRCDYHLSYPQVFKYQNLWYMLPETSGNNTVELWVATSFPGHWARHAILINDIKAVDATLHQDGDRWWLFAAVKKDCKKFGDKLYAWHASSPLSTEWTAHTNNPIRSGMLFDRPAGALIQHRSALLRPAQDSVKRYGGAIELREVTELSPSAYAEHAVARLEFSPESGFVGTHTINSCDGMLVIDLLRMVEKEER